MTSVLLIRHGETLWNLAGRIQGWQDSRLSEAGRMQAQALAERLRDEELHALVVSDLGRALETAAPIAVATGLEVVPEAGLRERGYGRLEGLTWDEIEIEHPESYVRLHARDPHYAMPEGESAVQFRDRVMGALDAIVERHRGQRVAVVAHGGVLGIAYRHAMGIALDAPRDYPLHNASINRMTRDEAGWRVDAWGETVHLDAADEIIDRRHHA